MFTHPSVVASAAAGCTLGAVSIARPLPWWVWGAWAALTVVSLVQARRADHG